MRKPTPTVSKLYVPIYFSIIIVEEFSRAEYLVSRGNIRVHSDIVVHYFINLATGQKKLAYLTKMVTGERVTS